MSPVDLKDIVGNLIAGTHECLLVGMETMDDAGVYKLTDEIALVQTVDYITPVVDDPFLFGQVAAANSLSDVYAMGGRPLTVLNLCNFPDKGVDHQVFAEIVRGALTKIRESGAVLVGGHTVKDEELKYGLSVTGVVHPDKIVRNSTAKPGDRIILTKPIGTGVLITGYKLGIVSPETMDKAAQMMASLNGAACEAMLEVGVHAATDITGFALAGHALEMASGSRVGIRIGLDALPYYPEALELIAQGARTGATTSNQQLVEGMVEFEPGIKEEEQMLFYDPQTSGGLFIALAADDADELLALLKERGVGEAKLVGETFATESPKLVVEKSL